MKKRNLLIPFALSNLYGHLVEPSDASLQKSDAYFCESCKNEVILKRGARKRAHFAHDTNVSCATGLETSIHRAAKQLIEHERKLWLPATIVFPFYPNDTSPIRAASAQVITVEKVEVEKSLGNIRPDLIVWFRGRPLAVEIEVTNPVSEEKSEIYRKNRVPAIRFDLKTFSKEATFEILKKLLMHPNSYVHWIHNDLDKRIEKLFLSESVFRPLTWRESHKHVGKIPHVDSCPLKFRYSKTHQHSFANAKLDCPACAYGIVNPPYKKIYSVRCAGHLADRFPVPTKLDWNPEEQNTLDTQPSLFSNCDER